jgi:uncharacterized protein (DUF736 family)
MERLVGNRQEWCDGTVALAPLSSTTSPAANATEERKDCAPEHPVFAGTGEIGAAWMKTSDASCDCLLLKLDDSGFPAPIYDGVIDMGMSRVRYCLIRTWAQKHRVARPQGWVRAHMGQRRLASERPERLTELRCQTVQS